MSRLSWVLGIFALVCASSGPPAVGAMLYFTDWPAAGACIGRIDPGTMQNEWLMSDGLDSAYRIAVDPAAGKMYWTETYAWEIRRANLDGSGEELVTVTPGVG